MSVAAAAHSESKSTPASLWIAGLKGGIYVLAVLFVMFFGLPYLWNAGVSGWLTHLGRMVDWSFLLVAEAVVLTLLIVFRTSLVGHTQQRGTRGAIFLTVASVFIGLFLVRGLLSVVERMLAKPDLGYVVSLAFYAAGLFLFWKFIKSSRLPRWSLTIESAGWFDAKSYKRNQGLRVRRFTIFGILLLFGSGVYTMVHNNVLGDGDWTIAVPFTDNSVTVLSHVRYTVPLLLIGLSIWFAWRVVNFPVFADFLIATEAEINKVSWTPRARLIQDTIVVLVTVALMTGFLFFVDIFWGWFLSRDLISVLPTTADKEKTLQSQRVTTNEW